MLPSFASMRDENVPPTRSPTAARVVCQSSVAAFRRTTSSGVVQARQTTSSGARMVVSMAILMAALPWQEAWGHAIGLAASAWSDPLFRSTVALTVVLLISGTAFYSTVERLTLLDALYLSVMTLTTVGYGDLHPVTPAGKVFTMTFVFLGVGVLVAFVTRLAQALRSNPFPG